MKQANLQVELTLLCLVVCCFVFSAHAMNLTMFDSPQEIQKWRVSNDTVMGGISSSTVTAEGESLLFSGELRLEYNGGFVSVWRTPEKGLFSDDSERISITVKGDGRPYQLRLRTLASPRISYSASFETTSGEWTTHTFQLSDFTPVWRGRLVSGAPALRFEDIYQVGFLLADKNPGDFALKVQQIVALKQS
ncbi:CIA30 family protein [Alteromonas sediminis]|uniref:CIA30 family protein n=1 Tax=Alteromonas sediminis TaxID=2259342 RepID=A0A3N5YMP8_9ALTE|nr:CIA30 family protein [Alteromonas sediminis]RPJ66741.1 CIA30 family protein [Alteromonas sediminis]